MELESGPTLERKLLCWDNGRRGRRRSHEPLDDSESRGSEEPVSGASLELVVGGRRLEGRGGVVRASEGRRSSRGGEGSAVCVAEGATEDRTLWSAMACGAGLFCPAFVWSG